MLPGQHRPSAEHSLRLRKRLRHDVIRQSAQALGRAFIETSVVSDVSGVASSSAQALGRAFIETCRKTSHPLSVTKSAQALGRAFIETSFARHYSWRYPKSAQALGRAFIETMDLAALIRSWCGQHRPSAEHSLRRFEFRDERAVVV